ncbi:MULTISPECIES: homoserine O-acetyltransferase/O-succinyltransferase family protein [unclassified Francisella]|uniref:homoserine O-acetyltransferase/O-succinyltransferase family protein n=1 Tax=unclassified Francisella TaxID=2610885 RepID=UPI002E2F1DED|nr:MULTISPECIES: homoserine O-succinyltransferase [unclassified Francisella]MED7819729.1 homoserine O-succinyltransferase [Francisella sp. 19S2-4]MED7830552.1 homoserine O-succinyltransferase [Francisella sp. 19S2-10]
MRVKVKKSSEYFTDLKIDFSSKISFKNTSIKHLRIAVVNLMPTVKETEKQWREVLSQNSSTIVDFVFFHSLVRPTTRVDKTYLDENYANWQDYNFEELDGIVITGAPVELLEFDDVDFYKEVCEIISKSLEHNLSLMLVCWAAQAGLNYLYDIKKECLDHKLFGVYEHKLVNQDHPLLKGIDGQLKACVSRQTMIKDNNVLKYTDVILASPVDGLDCLVDKTHDITYMFNHLEYNKNTLEAEYLRDKAINNIAEPDNYYNADGNIDYSWQNDKITFYSNWLDILKKNS